jgi:hypothetical protein
MNISVIFVSFQITGSAGIIIKNTFEAKVKKDPLFLIKQKKYRKNCTFLSFRVYCQLAQKEQGD